MASIGRTRWRLFKFGLVVWLFLLAVQVNISVAQETSVAPPLTTARVVEEMVTRNEQRAQALESYRATRVYHLEYHGLAEKNADLVAAITYQRPDQLKFSIVSESGSALLNKQVLKRLMEAEVESMREENHRRTAIRPENYEFRLVAYERTLGHDFYVLEVMPRTKNKFQFRGQIWVEEKDFAVARIEGEPAKNPSWWTKRNVIHVTYGKQGDFWLPMRNETVTQVRILGWSLLTIIYQDYQILEIRGGRLTPVLKESSAIDFSTRATDAAIDADGENSDEDNAKADHHPIVPKQTNVPVTHTSLPFCAYLPLFDQCRLIVAEGHLEFKDVCLFDHGARLL